MDVPWWSWLAGVFGQSVGLLLVSFRPFPGAERAGGRGGWAGGINLEGNGLPSIYIVADAALPLVGPRCGRMASPGHWWTTLGDARAVEGFT